MAPNEEIGKILTALSEEYKTTFALDEDGFLTLDWGGIQPVTIYAPERGDVYALSSALLRLPLDKPVEPLLRWLLEMNLPGAADENLSFACAEDTIFLSRNCAVASDLDPNAFKRRIADFMKDAAAFDERLRSLIEGLPVGAPADYPAAGPFQPIAGNTREILRANLQQTRQNVRI